MPQGLPARAPTARTTARPVGRVALGLLLVLALLPAGIRPAVAGGQRPDLDAVLDAAARRSGVPAERWSAAVLERRSRRPAYLHEHTRALAPASVAKVLTAAAALDLLGPGHSFRTTLTARGEVDATGVLRGDLVVHGSGDPNLSGRLFGGETTFALDRLVAGAAKAGIRVVTGSLVLDDGRFDREYVHPDWSDSDRARWYGAPVGGLSFNDSCVDVVVRGSRPGADAVLEVPSTAGPWRVSNRVDTEPGDTVVHAAWTDGGSVLTVTGHVPASARYAFSTPVREPVLFLGGALLERLSKAGVRVDGGTRLAREGEDRRRGRLLAEHESSIGPTLRVMNRRSQNFYAGLLFKALGIATEGRGSWAAGSRAVETMLRRRGLADDGKTRVVDGSGLSTANRATAATVAMVLAEFEEDLLRGPLLLESLAVPGEEGTLDDRLHTPDLRKRLHAKTGTLANSGVHALAGYLDGRDGDPGYAFAILVKDGRGRGLIDTLVTELARYGVR